MVYEFWFASLKSVSDKKKWMLREKCENAREIYYMEEKRLRLLPFLGETDIQALLDTESMRDTEQQYADMAEKEIRFIPRFAQDYPECLKNIADPPYALYVKGKLPDEKAPTAAIIGARQCTAYGEKMALEYGEILAGAGVQVISGMAKGIDGAGQRGALNGGGNTYSVLGCGVDICYPREHIGLCMDIQKKGGILSEYSPGTPPLAAHFPRRNRIISALADVILIIEARERSGSLITADFALEQGKDIYALPGPVTSPFSQGCHRLIRQGAGILITPQDLLQELQLDDGRRLGVSDKNKKVLETPENLVYSCLDFFPQSISRLMEETEMPPQQLMEILTSLEIEGMIKEISKNYYVRER